MTIILNYVIYCPIYIYIFYLGFLIHFHSPIVLLFLYFLLDFYSGEKLYWCAY